MATLRTGICSLPIKAFMASGTFLSSRMKSNSMVTTSRVMTSTTFMLLANWLVLSSRSTLTLPARKLAASSSEL